MILGDSLLVMNSLAEKEGLKGQVQMIYLDPPYGIKFGSNWQVSRVAIALARTRLMAAKFPYYLLADSEDGRRKEMEVTGKFVAQASAPAGSGGVPAASPGSEDAPGTRRRNGRATSPRRHRQ